jgi:hypothetical protein
MSNEEADEKKRATYERLMKYKLVTPDKLPKEFQGLSSSSHQNNSNTFQPFIQQQQTPTNQSPFSSLPASSSQLFSQMQKQQSSPSFHHNNNNLPSDLHRAVTNASFEFYGGTPGRSCI